MTTSEFIDKAVAGDIKSGRKCSSVFYEDDVIYSYGHHYPLLVKIGSAWILNDTGYSSTTGKHICWAKPHAMFVASFNLNTSNDPIIMLTEGIKNEITGIADELAKLSTRAWRQKQNLLERQKELFATRDYLIKNNII